MLEFISMLSVGKALPMKTRRFMFKEVGEEIHRDGNPSFGACSLDQLPKQEVLFDCHTIILLEILEVRRAKRT